MVVNGDDCDKIYVFLYELLFHNKEIIIIVIKFEVRSCTIEFSAE